MRKLIKQFVKRWSGSWTVSTSFSGCATKAASFAWDWRGECPQMKSAPVNLLDGFSGLQLKCGSGFDISHECREGTAARCTRQPFLIDSHPSESCWQSVWPIYFHVQRKCVNVKLAAFKITPIVVHENRAIVKSVLCAIMWIVCLSTAFPIATFVGWLAVRVMCVCYLQINNSTCLPAVASLANALR